MSGFSFFVRFTLVYTLAMAAMGIVVSGVLGLDAGKLNLNFAVLLGVTFWCFHSYSTKNNRIAKGGEKWKLIFLALLGDVLSSVLLSSISANANDIPTKYIFFALIIVTPLNFILIIVASYGVKKNLLKTRPEMGAE